MYLPSLLSFVIIPFMKKIISLSPSYFTEDFVPYEDTIKNMRKIIQDISF